jgi:hypothetical protein
MIRTPGGTMSGWVPGGVQRCLAPCGRQAGATGCARSDAEGSRGAAASEPGLRDPRRHGPPDGDVKALSRGDVLARVFRLVCARESTAAGWNSRPAGAEGADGEGAIATSPFRLRCVWPDRSRRGRIIWLAPMCAGSAPQLTACYRSALKVPS